MKSTTQYLLAVLCLGVLTARAQTRLQTLDVPTDPRSVALGESFTALPGDEVALMYNPAGLGGFSGATASYSRRNLNWMGMDLYYSGINATVAVPFGVFSAHYNRLHYETMVIPIPGSLPTYEEITPFQHDVALGYGMNVTDGLAAGLAVKYYDYDPGLSGFSTTPAWLFDAGILYSFPSFFPNPGTVQDQLSLGASLQNIGTKFRISSAARLSEQEVAPSSEPLPQFLRLGLAYSASLARDEESGLRPLSGMITAEFRQLLNSTRETGSYLGCGVEVTVYDVFTFRGGRVWLPFSSIYAEAKRASFFRYGTGISLPLEQLGVPIPFRCSANYTAIPLSSLGIGFGTPQRMLLDTYSFELHYTGGLW